MNTYRILNIGIYARSKKEAGSRVVIIKIDGSDIDEAKTYKLATNDFIVAGGDGYTMLKGKKVIAEYGAMDEILIDYLQENGYDASEVTVRIKDVSATSASLDKDYYFEGLGLVPCGVINVPILLHLFTYYFVVIGLKTTNICTSSALYYVKICSNL